MKDKPSQYMRMAPLLFALIIILAACHQEETAGEQARPGEAQPTTTLAAVEGTDTASSPTSVIRYVLGETIIVQDQFPEDSPFRNMPVRLDGVIGVPERGGQHPVVLIMHGSHSLCVGEYKWPCEEERANYAGFSYLVEELARAGYVALSINVNAEHTVAFGEGRPSERTKQLIDLHLGELAAANAGESNGFGLDLTDRVDLSSLVWIGHSRGGEFANRILREHDLWQVEDENGYGPIQGLILIAPALVISDSLPAANLATATILPACDQDFITLHGQSFFESARLEPERQDEATAVYLEGAIHNYFNADLDREFFEPIANRPDCIEEVLLSAEEQQKFLVEYTLDFLKALYAEPDQALKAKENLGFLTTEPAPSTLYGLDVKTNFLPATSDRLSLIVPNSEQELTQNALGGENQARDLTVTYCPEGYYGPEEEYGIGPCKRFLFNQPGNPQQLVAEWDSEDAEWRIRIPESAADLSLYEAVQLRAVVDPLSELNTKGVPQSFSLELVDANGHSAGAALPEIDFPEGINMSSDFVEDDIFSGHVYLQTLRVPFDSFEGIDLENITELALRFDQTKSGTLYIADIAFVKGG